MSIAWGSLVLLVILLPGVFFFVGLYLPEQFTRETAERSALGQLAATLFVAFGIHGILFCIAPWICGPTIPCVDLKSILSIFTLDATERDAFGPIATNLYTFRWWIFIYVLGTCALGVATGYGTGKAATKGWLRGLTQHTWIYDLSVGDNLTVAYVLTNTSESGRSLMYQGFLKAFALQKDGRFAYVVITDPLRGYMHLADHHPTTSPKDAWQPIGASGTFVPGSKKATDQYKRRDRSYFVIEGKDIANLVFDRLKFDYSAALTDLTRIIGEVRATFDTPTP